MPFVGLHTRVLFHVEDFQRVLSGDEKGSVNMIDRYLVNTSSYVDRLFEFSVGFLEKKRIVKRSSQRQELPRGERLRSRDP